MKKIFKFDASSLKESSCDLRFWNITVEGYTGGLVTNDVLFGSAIHKFNEVIVKSNGHFKDAITAMKIVFDRPCIIKSNKKYLTLNYLTQTCLNYWDEFLSKDDFSYFIMPNGEPAVELQFSMKIYEDDNIEIYLEGTIDKFGKINNGCYAIGDYKATSSWNPKEYFEGYRLSPQLKTYIYAVNRLAKDNPDSAFASKAGTQIGAFIDGIFFTPSNPSKFQRSEVIVFKPEQMDEYETLLQRTCNDFALMYSHYLATNEVPLGNGLINGSCETKYGRCKYFNVCAAPDKVSAGHLLKRDFVKKEYQPLMFGKD